MDTLSYRTLEKLQYKGFLLKEAPERVLQFGEGNFLRAFVDFFVDVMNEKAGFDSKVVLVQPGARHPDLADRINAQDGLYTLYLRGFEHGHAVSRKRIISCVSRCLNCFRDYSAVMECAKNPELRFLVCNTTEAGIVYDPACSFADAPPSSYPAKLTQFLYRRFLEFGDEAGKGFIILACELIDDNGQELRRCVRRYAEQWRLGDDFARWLERENIFCSTLVDRIVTGYPHGEETVLQAENGYIDHLIDTGEVFASWVIEGPDWLGRELPFEKAGLPILLTRDHRPYKQRKVRILNGAHTSMVMGAFLAGRDIVRECMEDEVIAGFLEKAVRDEILPTLPLPRKECLEFAAAVTERFRNPFIDHALLAISLNSTAKWKARVLPSLLDYVNRFRALPPCLSVSFAFYLTFYQGDALTEQGLVARRTGGDVYTVLDDWAVLEFFFRHREDSPAELVHAVCKNVDFWGRDLSEIPGFEREVVRLFQDVRDRGTYAVMKSVL